MQGHAAAKNRSLLIPWLFLTLCLGVVLISFSGNLNLKLSPALLYHHLIWPFFKLLFYLGVGLFIGQVIESLGWAARFGSHVRPLVSWGRFGPESAAAFSASFFSGILANTMLMSCYQDGKLSRRELTLSYLLNTGLPGFVLHLPTTFFILVPLTRQAGLIYLGLNLIAAVLRTVGVLALCSFDVKTCRGCWAVCRSNRPNCQNQVCRRSGRNFAAVSSVWFVTPCPFI